MVPACKESGVVPFYSQFLSGLVLKCLLFAFWGIGWDLLVTATQKWIAGTQTLDMVYPASVWMFFIYGLIPVLVFPLHKLFEHFKIPYPVRILIFLVLFYAVEYLWGFTFHQLGITPWSYDWNLDPSWTLDGYITWHPIILTEWLIFIIVVYKVHNTLIEHWPAES